MAKMELLYYLIELKISQRVYKHKEDSDNDNKMVAKRNKDEQDKKKPTVQY